MNITKKNLIYIIEDEEDLGQLICQSLMNIHVEAKHFINGETAIKELENTQPDICIIDLNLPDMDGMQLVKSLENKKTGIIVVSGRNDLTDRVLGLEFGADDYITKPFEPRELVARVQSLLRRINNNPEENPSSQPKHAYFGDWIFQPESLNIKNTELKVEECISRVEGNMLLALIKHPFQILSRNQLLGENYAPYDRSIDVRVSRLRKKIELDPQNPEFIKTIYGAGYMFTSEVRWN